MEKQTDCEVCTGKEVVENGVCRNCGAGKPVSDLKESGSDLEPSGKTGVEELEPPKTE